jgi:phage-related protein
MSVADLPPCPLVSRNTRQVSWFSSARREFDAFPPGARDRIADALTVAAKGRKADTAKPMRGFGSGVFEVAVAHRGEAYRLVYVVQHDRDVWVIHAFQKKSKTGISTPRTEIDLIRERLKRLRELP